MKGLSIATALFTFSYLFKSYHYYYFTNNLTPETSYTSCFNNHSIYSAIATFQSANIKSVVNFNI